MERRKSFCSLPRLRGPVRDCMDVSAALLVQLEALATRFLSLARPAAAASRAPLGNRQRHGAVLAPGAECTRRRDEILKEISFSQGPSAKHASITEAVLRPLGVLDLEKTYSITFSSTAMALNCSLRKKYYYRIQTHEYSLPTNT